MVGRRCSGDLERDVHCHACRLLCIRATARIPHLTLSLPCSIFNSFVEAYTPCEATFDEKGVATINYNRCDAEFYGYTATGIPFNDAYRCKLPRPNSLTRIDFPFDFREQLARPVSWTLG